MIQNYKNHCFSHFVANDPGEYVYLGTIVSSNGERTADGYGPCGHASLPVGEVVVCG